jgi:hypothetical protein
MGIGDAVKGREEKTLTHVESRLHFYSSQQRFGGADF